MSISIECELILGLNEHSFRSLSMDLGMSFFLRFVFIGEEVRRSKDFSSLEAMLRDFFERRGWKEQLAMSLS